MDCKFCGKDVREFARLRAENHELRTQLERMKEERDAAEALLVEHSDSTGETVEISYRAVALCRQRGLIK